MRWRCQRCCQWRLCVAVVCCVCCVSHNPVGLGCRPGRAGQGRAKAQQAPLTEWGGVCGFHGKRRRVVWWCGFTGGFTVLFAMRTAWGSRCCAGLLRLWHQACCWCCWLLLKPLPAVMPCMGGDAGQPLEADSVGCLGELSPTSAFFGLFVFGASASFICSSAHVPYTYALRASQRDGRPTASGWHGTTRERVMGAAT